MRYIKKSNEPKSLVEHRAQSESNYSNIPTEAKKELKESLLDEQGYTCCYCMKRINESDMKIEHWKSQSNYPELDLNYKNLLGACNGNEGQPKRLQCCDTYKGDLEINISPLAPNCNTLIKYRSDGTIYSEDTDLNRDLNHVLNLNLKTIKDNRRSVIEVTKQYLDKKYKGTWTKAILKKEIDKWNSKDNKGKYREYYGVVLFYLERLYRKATI